MGGPPQWIEALRILPVQLERTPAGEKFFDPPSCAGSTVWTVLIWKGSIFRELTTMTLRAPACGGLRNPVATHESVRYERASSGRLT